MFPDMFTRAPKGFISVDPSDLKVNEPLPYPIFDDEGRLLLEKDYIPISELQIERLKRGFTPNVDNDIGKQIIDGMKKKAEETAVDPLFMLDEVKNTLDKVLKLYHSDKLQNVDMLEDIAGATSGLVNNLPRFSASWLLLAARSEDLADYYKYLPLKIAIYSMIIGRNFFSHKEDLAKLTIVALLHDIGNSMIPPAILNKPSSLSEEEWEIIKKHPYHSIEILKRLGIKDEKVFNAVLYHHEKLAGGGYFGKTGDEIPIESQIVSVAMAYNAMISNRPHKVGMEPRDAIKLLWGDCDKVYKKICVEYLIKELGVYPIGSIVKLNTEEVGMVVKNSKVNPIKPIVWILIDRKGERSFSNIIRDTSISDSSNNEQKIVSVLPPSSLGFIPNVPRVVLDSKILK